MEPDEYRKYALLFDLSDLSVDMREIALPVDRVKVMCVALWASYSDTTMIHYYWHKPTYEEELFVINLNSEHWIAYQLIKDLPIKQIIEFFVNQTN